MNDDMEEVFKRKVDEKQDKMKRLEKDEESRLEKDRKLIEEEKNYIHSKREELLSWHLSHNDMPIYNSPREELEANKMSS